MTDQLSDERHRQLSKIHSSLADLTIMWGVETGERPPQRLLDARDLILEELHRFSRPPGFVMTDNSFEEK